MAGLPQRSLQSLAATGARPVLLWVLTLFLALTAAAQTEKVQLVGVGTTSALALYSRWFQTYERLYPEVHFVYMPSGSESGVDMVRARMADFGSTDVALTAKELARINMAQFPAVVGALVPIYNLPGIASILKFSPQALAGIYLGTITRWNDPFLCELNPEVSLPPSNIVVIHSASGRGSTFIWSDYLSKVSPEWRTRIGRGISISWPVGKEADGSGNLADIVKKTPNSLGFVQFVYALQHQLPWAEVRNAAGNFVRPNAANLQAAAGDYGQISDAPNSITNPAGAKAYPISSFVWILVPRSESQAKRRALQEFLRWALTDGQKYAEFSGFAPLPRTLAEQELKALDELP